MEALVDGQSGAARTVVSPLISRRPVGPSVDAGRRRAVEIFSQDAVVARYRQLYDRVMLRS